MKPTFLALHLVLAMVLLFPCLVLADEPAAAPAGGSAVLVNIELDNVTVRDAITKLFEGRTESYLIEPGVSGKIAELKLKGITLQQAVKALTDAAGLRYEVDNRTYIIGLKPAAAVAVTTVTMAPTAVAPAEAPEPVYEQPVYEPTVSSQLMAYEEPAPVFYGQPPMPYPYGGGGYPPPYMIGNVQVLPGWPSVVITGAGPSVVGPSQVPFMLGGRLSPDELRFWSYQNAMEPQFYYGPGYGGPYW